MSIIRDYMAAAMTVGATTSRMSKGGGKQKVLTSKQKKRRAKAKASRKARKKNRK